MIIILEMKRGRYKLYLKSIKKKYPFILEEIKAHEIDEIKVSSTKIRNAIDNGNIHLFKDYCGHFYEFSWECCLWKWDW